MDPAGSGNELQLAASCTRHSLGAGFAQPFRTRRIFRAGFSDSKTTCDVIQKRDKAIQPYQQYTHASGSNLSKSESHLRTSNFGILTFRGSVGLVRQGGHQSAPAGSVPQKLLARMANTSSCKRAGLWPSTDVRAAFGLRSRFQIPPTGPQVLPVTS